MQWRILLSLFFTFWLIRSQIAYSVEKVSVPVVEKIQEVKVENQLKERVPEILSIIRIRPGDSFDLDALENAINDLRKWGVFKDIEVLVEHEAGKVSLTFQIEDAYLIKSLKINGNYPLLERKVKRAIFFSPGDIYQPEKVSEQIDRLISFYEKEGFKDTSVLIEKETDEEKRTVLLTVRIKKGKTFGIGEVKVVGNTVFKESRIRNKIGKVFGYEPSRIKKNIEEISSLYHSKGYPRVRVKLKDVEWDEEKRKVNLTLDIHEGKKIEVLFEGNKRQFSRRLIKVVSVPQTGDTDDFELEHSKNLLLSHYHSIGYEEAVVEVEKKVVDEHTVQVLFKVQEGERKLIKAIGFEGNDSFKDKKIRAQMFTKEQGIGTKGVFQQDLFDQDLQRIEKFYSQNGFLEMKVDSWKRSLNKTEDKYILELNVQEGDPTEIDSIVLKGNQGISSKEIKDFFVLKEKGFYSPDRLEEDVRALLVYYSQKGYPYAEVKTDLEEKGDHKVLIHYDIQEGDLVKIGKILFVGNDKTRSQNIRKALRFQEGDVFNPQKILASQTSLRKMGIFDSISLETLGLKAKAKDVHVVVHVEEKKRKIFDVGLSYDTDTSFKAKLIYTRLNLFGRGKQLDLKLTGGFQFNRGEIVYTSPRFFATDWQFLANVFSQYERRPLFEDFQLGGSVALYRELTRRLSLLIKYEVSHDNFVEDKTDFSVLKLGTSDNTIGKFQFSATYDRRDNFGDPRSGFFSSGKFDFGTSVLGPNANFVKIGGRFGYWWSPFSALTVANAFRINGVIPISGGKDIPIQEQIFMGGDDTVRGFKEDALGVGKFGLIHNLELQFRLFKGFQLVGFLDSGSLTNSIQCFGSKSLRHSAGFGIHYVTPVGPIRFDYGFVLDRKKDEPPRRLHFTFGYFF